MTIRHALVLAGTALALLPTGAQAATTTLALNGTTLTITGDGGVNDIDVSSAYVNGSFDWISISALSSDTVTNPGGGCQQPYAYQVNCPPGSITAITATLGAGNDLYAQYNDGIADTVYGEVGNDDITGAMAGDDAGKEAVDFIDGGPGDDVVNGGDGDDGTFYLYGGLDGGEGADQIHGGPGVDEFSEERNVDLVHYWSLDDVANDGADGDASGSAEEGDNLHSDVENVETDYDAVVIVGSAANNKLVGGLGDDLISGGGGDDELNGGLGGKNDRLDGGDGNDQLSADGHLTGGAGNDKLIGHGGDGLLEPGPGVDSVSAYGGNDVVRAADGEVDTIGCGVGADIAEVDQLDVVNTNDDGDNCEQVKRTTTAAPSTGQTGTGNLNAGAVQLILGGGGSFKGSVATFSATAPGAGRIAATVTLASGRAAAAAATVLGRKTTTVTRAGKVRLKVTLKGKAWKRLKRKRSVRVKLTTVFTPQGGTAGPKTSKVVKLKRAR